MGEGDDATSGHWIQMEDGEDDGDPNSVHWMQMEEGSEHGMDDAGDEFHPSMLQGESEDGDQYVIIGEDGEYHAMGGIDMSEEMFQAIGRMGEEDSGEYEDNEPPMHEEL